jgi:CHAT domain-containing protein
MAHPDDPEAARCFWNDAKQTGRRDEVSRRVRRLLARYPHNLGLELYSAVLEPPLPDRGETVMRSVAGRFSHGNAVGEILARENLVNLLIRQARFDEAGREVQREMAVAQVLTEPTRSRYLALAEVTGALLASIGGDYQRAGLLLDEVSPGPLRDERWLVVAIRVHQETGQTERTWNECLQLSRPPYSHAARASGLYGQVRVLAERAAELPAEANTSRIERTARDAIAEARAGGNARVEVFAHYLLAALAKAGAQSQAELRRCLEVAAEEPLKQLCRGALDRERALAGEAPAGDPNGENGGVGLMDPVTRAQTLGAEMRVSWKTLSLDGFIRDAWHTLAEIERLRARQTDPEIQEGLFSTWSDDYYWFSGRLLEATLAGRCAPCLDLAFEVVERLRARTLHAILLAARAGTAAAAPDAVQLAALRQATGRVTARRQDSALPASERENAADDLAAFKVEEEQLRRHAAALHAASGSGSTAPPGPGGRGMRPDAFATVAKVQALLEPDEALLSFQVAPWRDWTGDFGGGSWLVVATRAGRRCYRLGEMGREALRGAVADFFAHRAGSHAWQAAELYRRLLGPALAELAPDVKRLIVVPDDHLHRLAIAALRPRPDEPPIVGRYQISIVPSATLWANWRAARRPIPAERPALALADPPPPTPAMRQRFAAGGIILPAEPLPGARREADAMARSLGWRCERRVGGEVSAATLLDSRASLPRFALVHFAAHAIVDDRDPRRSGIWLSPSTGHDGLVRAAEVAKLDFHDRLIVLATCSGNGGRILRGEGVMSLAHAFFQARARTVVASLWPQVDTDAEALVTAFYRHLASGRSVAAALRLAQLDLLHRDPRLLPVAWAGMVVLGDGELVPFPGGRHPWRPWFVAAALIAAVLALLSAWRQFGRRPAVTDSWRRRRRRGR